MRAGTSHESNSDKESLSQRWTWLFIVFTSVSKTFPKLSALVMFNQVCLFYIKVPNSWTLSGWQTGSSIILYAHGALVNLSSYLEGVHDEEYTPFYFVDFTGEIKCKTGCGTAVQNSPCDFILHCLQLLLFFYVCFVPFTCFFCLHIWTSRLLKIYWSHLPLFFQLKHIYFAVHLKLPSYIDQLRGSITHADMRKAHLSSGSCCFLLDLEAVKEVKA